MLSPLLPLALTRLMMLLLVVKPSISFLLLKLGKVAGPAESLWTDLPLAVPDEERRRKKRQKKRYKKESDEEVQR
jgi:hypothetical protein